MKTIGQILSASLLSKGLLLASSMIALPASANGPMTLRDCLMYARDHAHTNLIDRAEIIQASARKGIAASALMPRVSLSSEGNMSFGRNIDPETNTYGTQQTLYTGFSLNFALPLFDGLVSINNLKASKIALQRKVSDAQIEQDQVSLNVIKAFYNVFYCKELVRHFTEQMQRDSTDLASTVRLMELGTKSGADVAEMRAVVAEDHYNLTNQSNQLKKAYMNLRSLMGMEITDEPLDLIESRQPDTPTVAEAGTNPKIQEASLALRQSIMARRAAAGAFSPEITLHGGASTSYYRMTGQRVSTPGFSRQWHDNMGEYIGITVSLPIFSGLSNIHKLKLAKAEVLAAELRLDKVRYEVELETREAELDYFGALEEAESAARKLEAEEIAFKAIRRKYELGSASVLELYAVGAKLAKARAENEGKRINVIISRLTLDYYRGIPFIR